MLEGEIPSVMNRPKGCAFFNRCPMATKECSEVEPPLIEAEEGHSVACIKVRKEVCV